MKVEKDYNNGDWYAFDPMVLDTKGEHEFIHPDSVVYVVVKDDKVILGPLRASRVNWKSWEVIAYRVDKVHKPRVEEAPVWWFGNHKVVVTFVDGVPQEATIAPFNRGEE